MIEYIDKKVIRYGGYVDISVYEKPLLRGYTVKKSTGRVFKKTDTEEKKTDFSIHRAKTKIRRIVNANPELNKFATLTFADWTNIFEHQNKNLDFEYIGNPRNIAECNDAFRKFALRAEYSMEQKLHYICIPELQKNGNVHYHVLYDLPFLNTSKLASIWKAGFVKINRIDNVSNVGAYVGKYLSKENTKDSLANKKTFSYSSGLKQPFEIPEANLEKMELKQEKEYHYDTEYHGHVDITINRILREL